MGQAYRWLTLSGFVIEPLVLKNIFRNTSDCVSPSASYAAPISLSKNSTYWNSPIVMQLLKLRAEHGISLAEIQKALGVLGFDVPLTKLDEKLKDPGILDGRLRGYCPKQQIARTPHFLRALDQAHAALEHSNASNRLISKPQCSAAQLPTVVNKSLSASLAGRIRPYESFASDNDNDCISLPRSCSEASNFERLQTHQLENHGGLESQSCQHLSMVVNGHLLPQIRSLTVMVPRCTATHARGNAPFKANDKRSWSPSTQLDRAVHNETEKKRRVNIRKYLNKLKLALPSDVGAPLDTTLSILSRSCHYLRWLKAHREQLLRRRNQILIERARLINEFEQLKRQLQIELDVHDISESLGSDLASPASPVPTKGRWSKLTSVTKKPTDDACSQFCKALEKAESSQLAASEEENETRPSSSSTKVRTAETMNATDGLVAVKRLQALVAMLDAELGQPIERLLITDGAGRPIRPNNYDTGDYNKPRSTTPHEFLDTSEQEHPTNHNRCDDVVRLEPTHSDSTTKAHLLAEVVESDDLEEEHLLNLLTYYESKLHKLRDSGFTVRSDAPFSPFNNNLRSLLKSQKHLDVLIPGTTIYSETRKQGAILAPPNLPRLSAWLSADIFLSVEWSKTLPVVERLGLCDKERLLLATGLVTTMMTQCFHSYVKGSITVVMPDYQMPMKVRHFPRLENEIFCRPLETLHRVRPTAVEYVLLKAIVCCQPDAPGLSSPAQLALAEERDRYARILLRHCQEEIGEENGAGRFAELLEVSEAFIYFAQRRREHFALTAVTFKAPNRRLDQFVEDVKRGPELHPFMF